MVDMKAVRSDLSKKGWSRQTATVDQLRRAALQDGLRGAYRAGSNERVLVPYEVDKAPRRSLSAVYGLGAQPLHTDGAHLRVLPDVILLHCSEPSTTSTLVWTLSRQGENAVPSAARQGVFTVRGSGESFLASALDQSGLRFDPVVMSPGDALARETADYFREARSRAHVHEWDEPNSVLFIANRKALHAREAVSDAETRAITRIAYTWGSRK